MLAARKALRALASGAQRAADALVQPYTLRPDFAQEGAGVPQPGGKDYQAIVAQAQFDYALAKLGQGSQLGYKGAWRQWTGFCRARKA